MMFEIKVGLPEEKQIKEWINNKKFSRLSFLDNVWVTSKNDSYIGFYYFIQDLKNKNLDTVFNEIVSRKGSESNAYLYLGRIAHNLFDTFRTAHIPISFFKKAIELDDKNAEAHWFVYYINSDLKSFINALKIDYENKKIDELNSKIRSLFNFLDLGEANENDLISLKEILTHIDLKYTEKTNNILISIYFYLNDFPEGLRLIENTEKVRPEIIQKYLEKNLISLDRTIEKLHYWQVDEFLNQYPSRIYTEYLKEAKKGGINPIKEVLIHKAFLANEFNDVISHFNEALQTSDFVDSMKSHLHYLLAQLATYQPLDEKILNYINQKSNSLGSSSTEKYNKFLLLVLNFKLKYREIEKDLEKDFVSDFPIDIYSPFQQASKILDSSEIINHQIYDELKSQLNNLKQKWNRTRGQLELNNYIDIMNQEDISESDFFQYCHHAIEFEEYDSVIKNIEVFHSKNKASMTTYNCLGVCYNYKEDYINAIYYYKKALNLMHSSEEQNFTIIENYLNCVEKCPCAELANEELLELKYEFNLSLTNHFKWHHSCSDRFNILYKYSPFNINSIDALANQYFYLPGKKQLNDPIELPKLDKLKSTSLIHESYNICSFSNNENSMLMWSHYAQQHQGIMVEYWFGGELPSGFGISKVSYADDIKRQKEKDIYLFNQFLLTKNKDWSYENEVRLFSFLKNKVEFGTYQYPSPNRNIINAKIQSITLGLKFPDDKKKLISNLIKSLNNQRYDHESKIILKKAEICEDNNFSLRYREIDLD